MPDGPLLWFLNRGSGFALLGVLTLTVLLGVLSRGGRAGGLVPGFVAQSLHRSTSMLALSLLAVHVVTAVADEFVDIRWWHAVVPWGASYEPFWLALGALSVDLMAAVVVTSALRRHLGHRVWRAVHYLAYAAWAVGVAHGLGIGTDSTERWAAVPYAGSILVVCLAGLVRASEHATADDRERMEVWR
jgi:methionine sulfoxide reductase heme-binding subunit